MPDFSLAAVPNFSQAALSGYAAGRKIGQQRRTDQALQTYSKDPDAGVAAAYQFDPELGGALSKANRERQATAALGAVFKPTGQAAPQALGASPANMGRGNIDLNNQQAQQYGARPTPPLQRQDGLQINVGALRELAKYDSEQAMKIAEFSTKATKDQLAIAADHAQLKAQAAAHLQQFPEAERATELQRIAPRLMEAGFTAEQLGSAILTDAQLRADQFSGLTFKDIVDNAREDKKVVWHQTGENGSFATDNFGNPVGSQNPYAQGQKSPAAPSSEAPVSNGQSVIQSIFPGVRVTQNRRDPNSALGRANPGSYHNKTGGAVDVAPIPGMTFEQYVQGIRDAGYTVIEARDEVKNPSAHATGPHWHAVIGGKAPSSGGASGLAAEAEAAIAAGADPAAVRARLAQLGGQ